MESLYCCRLRKAKYKIFQYQNKKIVHKDQSSTETLKSFTVNIIFYIFLRCDLLQNLKKKFTFPTLFSQIINF